MVSHMKRVGKIALGVGLLTAVSLSLVVFYLAGEPGDSYVQIIQSYSLSKKQLAPTLGLAGLLLLTVAGLVTWVITIYSTFRVAGPLYRFSCTLEKEIEEGPLPVDKIRTTDLLQQEHQLLAEGVKNLQDHYDAMSELVDLAQFQLDLPDPNLGGGLNKTLSELKNLDRRVHL